MLEEETEERLAISKKINGLKDQKAENYYQKFLTEFPATINLLNKAGALNNLAVLHRAKNELESAYKNMKKHWR